jgi:hypothetical protein
MLREARAAVVAVMEVHHTREWRRVQGFPHDREVRVGFHPVVPEPAGLLRREGLRTFRATARILRLGLRDAGGMIETSP